MNIVKLVLLIIIFWPAVAYAYLDPGTANAVAASLFGLLASALFFSKTLYYKIKAKITGKEYKPNKETLIAFYSEGKAYWPYYKDILLELIKMKVHFTYYTQDLDDPAFSILPLGDANADIDAFNIEYVGAKNKGYAFISKLSQPVLVTTTPNIGSKNYPIKKPPLCKNLVHIYHGIASVGGYKKYSLDCFDTVILTGKEFAADILELEKKRNLKPKKLLIGGLPYLDSLIERAKSIDQATDGNTVLIASTWDKRGVLRTYGADLIKSIAEAGFNIIVRPHPYSYIHEADFIAGLEADFKDYKNVSFDRAIDNLKSLAKADILISDVSGVRFDFIFAFNRPVISLETDAQSKDDYDCADLDSYWDIDVSDKLGAYVCRGDINKLPNIIKYTLAQKRNFAQDQEILANIGNSACVIAGQIKDIAKEVV
jgi:hypothetical protein